MSLKHFSEHWYWEQFNPDTYRANAAVATLRQGLGRPAGTVPALWRFHRVEVPDSVAAHGFSTPKLMAEHATLTLFGWHQRSQKVSMHRSGVSLGTALRVLRARGSNTEGLDRQVTAAAVSSSADVFVERLRGLIGQLRGISQPLDYTALLHDIYQWHYPDSQNRARRRLGAAYYAWTPPPSSDANDQPDSPDPASPSDSSAGNPLTAPA